MWTWLTAWLLNLYLNFEWHSILWHMQNHWDKEMQASRIKNGCLLFYKNSAWFWFRKFKNKQLKHTRGFHIFTLFGFFYRTSLLLLLLRVTSFLFNFGFLTLFCKRAALKTLLALLRMHLCFNSFMVGKTKEVFSLSLSFLIQMVKSIMKLKFYFYKQIL